MLDYLVKRLLLLIPVLVGISILVFTSVRFIPGDVVNVLLQDTSKKERLDEMREALGLTRPLHEQYLSWLWGSLHGDLGRSFYNGQPVLPEIIRRLPVTVELAILALGFAILVAIPAGVISALRQDTPLDYLVRITSMAGLSMPNFWLGTLLLVFPALWFRWIPPLGYVPIFKDPQVNLQQFLLPAMALGFHMSATSMRMTRSAMLEVLRQDYIRTAWSKGLRERAVIYHHALKNAMIPVITIMGNQFGFLLGGTVVMETIFSLPGMGRLTLDAIYQRDYPQLQANVLFVATFYVLVNLLVDVAYAWFDPRIRHQ